MILDALIENFDMEGYLTDNGYIVKNIGGQTDSLLSSCPFCYKEYHCGINFSKRWFGCFKCHTVGDFFKLLVKVSGKSYFETLEFLKTKIDKKHIDVNMFDFIIKEGNKFEANQKKIKPMPLPEGYISLRDKQIPYTKKRKITQDQVNYYRMGVCYEGVYKNRLIVCDVNEQQEVIYWIARDISGKVDKRLKVLNPKILDSSVAGSADLLFNYHLTKKYSCGIVTEGVFDALWVGNNGMATYGCGFKKNHIPYLISAQFQTIYIMYDSDVGGRELERYALLTSLFVPTYICKLPKGDPDDYSKEELASLLQNARQFTGGAELDKLEVSFAV